MATETLTPRRELDDRAHESSALMFDVAALLHALTTLNESGNQPISTAGMADSQSMMANLLAQASDKTSAAINALNV